MAVAMNAPERPEREFDGRWKGAFGCGYEAKAAPVRPMEMAVVGGAPDHRELTSGPVLTGARPTYSQAPFPHVKARRGGLSFKHAELQNNQRTVFKSVFGGD